ncbi:MAG: AraC family transcriptional regulator [Clostridia bacterium]|nr:AraC family transcriptional regulator [Clostridia bacterium]
MAQYRYIGRPGVYPLSALSSNSITNENLYVTHICHHCHAPKEYIPHHTPNNFCIHIITSGSVMVNGTLLNKGDGYFHRNNQYTITKVSDDNFEEVFVNYNGITANSFSNALGLTGKFKYIKLNATRDVDFIKNAVYADYEHIEQSLAMTSVLYMLAASISTNSIDFKNVFFTENAKHLNNKHVVEGLKYISTHFSEQITINDLAQHLHLSPNHICKLFKAHLNNTPQFILIQYRIDAAKKLLTNSNYPIMDIAEFVGYLDNRYFSQVFKKYVGYTPSRYRVLTRIKEEN